MKASRLYTSAALCCTLVTAWPSYLEPAELLARGRQILDIRQATTTSKSFNLSYSATQGQITATSTSGASKTTTGSATTTSGSGSVITGTSNTTGKATTTSNTQTSFDQSAGYGGISMVTPNPYSGSTFYKIEDYFTLGWNYTSCSVLPTAVDILAVASGSNILHTYTLATNQTVTGTSQAFTFDSNNYQATATDKLLTATYTLVVYDADEAVTATARPGYLATFNQFYFGMYSPGASSSSFAGVSCITCSGAMSSVEKQAYSVVFGMMALTVLSFTWFAGAAGVF